MADCVKCGSEIGALSALGVRICDACDQASVGNEGNANDFKDNKRLKSEGARRARLKRDADLVQLTTETYCADWVIDKRLGLVSAEVVLGVNIFKDFAAGIRNVIGGRSAIISSEFAEAKERALGELKSQAARKGADAVVAVQLSFKDIGATGSTMVLVTALGTAVRLKL